jgi:hypothetical protein
VDNFAKFDEEWVKYQKNGRYEGDSPAGKTA